MANRRHSQAEATKGEIIDAARELFLARGYVGTSLSAVADQAGVVVQTIYNSVGNKAALLSAVLDHVSGAPDGPRSVAEFMQERPDSPRGLSGLVGLLADWFVEVNERSIEVAALIRQTAAVYPEVAALERDRASRRLKNYGLIAGSVKARGGLTAGMTDGEAAAAIWSLGHPQVYTALVIEGGWDTEEYRRWLRRGLQQLLG